MTRNLLCKHIGLPLEVILTNREQYASDEVCLGIAESVSRLLKGEPLAYVLGEWDFYGMTLQVDPSVLIPRDDTCALAELAMKKGLFLDQNPRILDLCTGSGCIGLAVANRVKDARVTLADISAEALAVAKKNVARLQLGGRVSCVRVDALQPAPDFMGKFHMIISNPPYITTEEMLTLEPSVKNFEPHLAIHGGDDGLMFYRSIVENFSRALHPGGFLCFEFGEGQGDDICQILEDHGYTILERTRDFNGTERAVMARYDREEE
jgi:release factor glutamine methyltransferase